MKKNNKKSSESMGVSLNESRFFVEVSKESFKAAVLGITARRKKDDKKVYSPFDLRPLEPGTGIFSKKRKKTKKKR
jgi:hypothetical protein